MHNFYVNVNAKTKSSVIAPNSVSVYVGIAREHDKWNAYVGYEIRGDNVNAISEVSWSIKWKGVVIDTRVVKNTTGDAPIKGLQIIHQDLPLGIFDFLYVKPVKSISIKEQELGDQSPRSTIFANQVTGYIPGLNKTFNDPIAYVSVSMENLFTYYDSDYTWIFRINDFITYKLENTYIKQGTIWKPWYLNEYKLIVSNTTLQFPIGTRLEIVAIGGGGGGQWGGNYATDGEPTSFGDYVIADGGKNANGGYGGQVIAAVTTSAKKGGGDIEGPDINAGGGGGWGGGGGGAAGVHGQSGFDGGVGGKVRSDGKCSGGDGFVVTSSTKGKIITITNDVPIKIKIGSGGIGNGNFSTSRAIDGNGGHGKNAFNASGNGGAGALFWRYTL